MIDLSTFKEITINGESFVSLSINDVVIWKKSGEDLPPDNEIWYTSINNEVVSINEDYWGGETPLSNTYENGKGILKFENPIIDITELFDTDGSESAVNLKTVTLPNCVEIIGDAAFWTCENLYSINFPTSLTEIGEYAFTYTSFTSIKIPDSVTIIGNYAFDECPNLESVVIGNSVTIIGQNAFYECPNLESVVIGNSVTHIKGSAFYKCYKLATITLPQSLTSIGGSAFNYCSSLTTITVPKLVTTIGHAWILNTNIETVILEPTTPPTLGSRGTMPTTVNTIYVPAESVEAYKSATVWRNYADKIQAIPN